MIHVLYGADTFSRREAFEELRAALDTDGSLDTNTTRFAAHEATAAEVIAACAAVPFLGGVRLVVLEGLLRRAQEAAGRSKKPESVEKALAAWQPLVEFLPQMPDTTVLVLLDGAVPPGNPVLAALKGRAEVRVFAPPGPKELAGWVRERARRVGIEIDAKAVNALVQMVGGQDDLRGARYVDTWALAAELDKLAAYADGAPVREEDVKELSPFARDQKGYFLRDAVIERRPAAAAKLLQELLDQNHPGQVLLSTIAGGYRRLAIARDMLDAGERGDAIGRELNASGFGLDKLIEQASRYPPPLVRAAYERIAEADFNHKSGLSEEPVELHSLVQDLVQLR